MQRKEAESAAKRNSHIDAVLARRRGEYGKAVSDEARQQQQREERRRERELELEKLRAAERGEPAEPAPSKHTTEAESRWERMLNGGGKKKKRKAQAHDDDGVHSRDTSVAAGAPPGARHPPGDGISVDETNRLRESLGLKPLR